MLNINIADSPIRNIKNVLEGGRILKKNGGFKKSNGGIADSSIRNSVNIIGSPMRNIKNVLEGGRIFPKNGSFISQMEVSPLIKSRR